MSYTSEVLADSPVGFFKLNEAPGATTAVDSSTAANAVSYESGAVHAAGLISEYAYSLNTATAGAVGTIAAASTSSAAYTVEAWVTWESLTAGLIWHVRDNMNTGGAKWLEWTGTQVRFVYYSSGTRINALTFTPTLGTLYHIACVLDKGTNLTTWYVNGASQGSVTASGNNVPGESAGYPLTIGAQNSAGTLTNRFQGKVNGLAWYRSVLSAARISAHYSAGAAISNPSGSLAATMPAFGVSAAGTYADTATLTETFPAFNTEATATYTEPIPDLDIVFPSLDFSGFAEADSAATLAVTFPALTIDATGDVSNTSAGTLAATFPSFRTSLAGSLTAIVKTDVRNQYDARRRDALALVETDVATTPLPNLGQRVDKALAYPTPTLIDGRPT